MLYFFSIFFEFLHDTLMKKCKESNIVTMQSNKFCKYPQTKEYFLPQTIIKWMAPYRVSVKMFIAGVYADSVCFMSAMRTYLSKTIYFRKKAVKYIFSWVNTFPAVIKLMIS